MITNRLGIIFSNEELNRLTVIETNNKSLSITVDVHGMKCSQAKRFINNIINIIHVAFQLVIIHGYNHGTAIKNMLAQNFFNKHIESQYEDLYNQGITHMLIA